MTKSKVFDSNKLISDLKSLADPSYKDFMAGLLPNLDPKSIIGVRMPALRSYLKGLGSFDEVEVFLRDLPHRFYEENLLHMMIISRLKDYDLWKEELVIFFPYIDNWAVCDLPAKKDLLKNAHDLKVFIREHLKTDLPYQIRYLINLLRVFYLDDFFDDEVLELVLKVDSPSYYVKMMKAFFVQSLFVKDRDLALKILRDKVLDEKTQKMALRKILDSKRVDRLTKEYIRSLSL
ncbi:DNA alkylation repair protein [Peptoniphilus sp. GNH]|nr:DNA alkylation repair protein [Peptoniphilus sp. GNH]